MNIRTTCSNPNCTSRLHFIGGEYAYLKWIENRDNNVGGYDVRDSESMPPLPFDEEE